MRWSDAGFEPSDDNGFAALPQRDFRGRHGIVFHDACWSLLEAALKPASVSLQRLFDVCSSLPVPRKCRAPTWGHDFGGAVVVDKTVHFPWEDRYEVPESTKPDPVFSKNPYQVPGVDRLLAEDPQQPPAATQPARPPRDLALDCFAVLPGELCTAIAMLLPTADVLRARLASRAFWPVFYSQQFWASRFTPPPPAANRSWLFETRHVQSPRDWRWLYRRTNDVYLSPGLRNRRRIWGLIEQIVDILALVWNELPPSLPEIWSLDSSLRAMEYCVEVNGLLWSPTEPGDHRFHNGCRLSRTQSIAIPDALAYLSVYTVAFGDGRYVVGMSFVTVAGDSIRLGYSSRSEHLIELTQIWGFRLAMGSRGLQALQCITGPADSESPWLGSPDDVPRTERLVLTARVVGLEVGFDGCKMVRLAVRTRSPPSRHCGGLRDLAVWYPTIPPQNLCLNETSFLPRDFYTVGYKPLFWCHFGGPGGKYLRHLTAISAVSCLGILRIYFSFDIEVPWEYRSFGRLKLEEEYEDSTDFSIDGPGGERIETIKMPMGVITEEVGEGDDAY
ncbi:hypothetical protein C8A00DRAFT_45939 [Chaetomidium leptoderma]|uniref:DUF7600 domain-containing protein n=1 Tax=Chaetomidium leptoderma TaxID=669021 RepID=A0AAN6VFV6_9PEZI|nr:hypothetical protein C8A00DRAFT_45939 [Chaetomidium leptoderma]